MVSFQCDGCADTVKKPKLDQHRQRCWAPFTCLDCSKTFQNQDYKSHTSCISEAEKYQGALYKGAKKNGQPAPKATKATPVATPAESPAPSPSAAPAIHPSRLNQIDAPPQAEYSFSGRGGAARGRGGRGGALRAGGRFNPLVSGENKFSPEGGMRSWGSPNVTENNTPAPESAPVLLTTNSTSGGPEKKKRRKGDKGGTGSKANSKNPQGEEEREVKKRKRSPSPAPVAATVITAPAAASTPVDITEKTLKRLRKSAGKLESESSFDLSEWLKKVGENKKETLDAADVSRAVKVVYEGGKWVLSI